MPKLVLLLLLHTTGPLSRRGIHLIARTQQLTAVAASAASTSESPHIVVREWRSRDTAAVCHFHMSPLSLSLVVLRRRHQEPFQPVAAGGSHSMPKVSLVMSTGLSSWRRPNDGRLAERKGRMQSDQNPKLLSHFLSHAKKRACKVTKIISCSLPFLSRLLLYYYVVRTTSSVPIHRKKK